jgi:hypothetical protein
MAPPRGEPGMMENDETESRNPNQVRLTRSENVATEKRPTVTAQAEFICESLHNL